MGKVRKTQDGVDHGYTKRTKCELAAVSEAWNNDKIPEQCQSVQNVRHIIQPPRKDLRTSGSASSAAPVSV